MEEGGNLSEIKKKNLAYFKKTALAVALFSVNLSMRGFL